MASNSKTVYAPASSSYPYQIAISFTETEVDKTNNTSKISITGSIYGKNISYSGSNSTLAIYWIDNNNNTTAKHIITKTISSLAKGETSKASASITVKHKNDGTLSGYARVVWTKVGSNTYVPPTTTVDTANTKLTDILRGSSLGTISDFTIGDSISIPITKYVSSYTDTLEISLNNTVIKTISNITDDYEVNFTETELNNIYTLIPLTNGTFTFKLTTKNGDTTVGTSSKTAIGTINTDIVRPSFPTYTTEEVGDVPSEWGVFVKNKSKIKFVIKTTASAGSVIARVTTRFDGYTYEGLEFETEYLQGSGSKLVEIYVKDSRGIISSSATSIDVEDYDVPYITSASAIRSDSSGTADDNGTYLRVDLNAGVSSIAGNNTPSYQVLYKKTTDNEFTSKSIGGSSETYDGYVRIPGLDANSSYDVQVVVSDSFSSSTKILPTIPTSFSTIDYKAGGHGVAVGKAAEEEDLLDVAFNLKVHQDVEVLGDTNIEGNTNIGGNTNVSGDMNVTGGLTLNNTSIFDLIYPIGSIYISVNEVNPSTLFGGTWEQIKDRFLLGAGDTYGAGTTGGQANTIRDITGVSGNGYGGITTSNSPAYVNRVLVTTASYANSGSSMKTFKQYGLDFLPPYLSVYMWKRVS